MAPFCLPGLRSSLRLRISDVMGLLLLAAGFLARHFRAGAARLGQADGDRLLAALHLAPGAAAAQRSLLALVHRALDFALGFLAVAGHGVSSGVDCARQQQEASPAPSSSRAARAAGNRGAPRE